MSTSASESLFDESILKSPNSAINAEIEYPKPSGDAGDSATADEGECGLCLFMKGGGCKDNFVAWEKCVKEAEEDVVSKCDEMTMALMKCMETHAEYYGPLLGAGKVVEEAAIEKFADCFLNLH